MFRISTKTRQADVRELKNCLMNYFENCSTNLEFHKKNNKWINKYRTSNKVLKYWSDCRRRRRGFRIAWYSDAHETLLNISVD